MKYLRVAWKHQHPDEPVLIYSELDERRCEVRKVEVFRDARVGHASSVRSHGGTGLGIVAVPELNVIAEDAQFEPAEIMAEEFEEVWRQRGGR
jgi:hypothetical protein